MGFQFLYNSFKKIVAIAATFGCQPPFLFPPSISSFGMRFVQSDYCKLGVPISGYHIIWHCPINQQGFSVPLFFDFLTKEKPENSLGQSEFILKLLCLSLGEKGRGINLNLCLVFIHLFVLVCFKIFLRWAVTKQHQPLDSILMV